MAVGGSLGLLVYALRRDWAVAPTGQERADGEPWVGAAANR